MKNFVPIAVFLSAIFLLKVRLICGANILGIFPTPSSSHQIVYKALMEELFKRGHNVTVMTTDPDDSGYNKIDVHDISYEVYNNMVKNSDIYYPNNHSPKSHIEMACKIMLNVVEKQLKEPSVQELIQNHNNETYDLLFVEGIFPIAPAFKRRFKCPLILISSLSLTPSILDEFGNPLHPTLYPDVLAPFDARETTIWQRIYLLIRHFGYKYFFYMKYVPLFDGITRKYFGEERDKAISDNVDSENAADMVFLNFNPIWQGVRPLVPVIVPIASIHIKTPKPLPQDLQSLLDNATDGVIYFSFGTNIKARQLVESTRRVFTDTFRELPYTVLWKWEEENLPEKPDNVHTSKWFPQLSVLNHPNTKLFISQGGQQSLEESIHCGVPMLVLPMQFDQEANAFRVEKKGIGRRLNVLTFNKDILKKNIMEIIQNTEYQSNVTAFRDLVYDTPQTSMERAVWWTEYVLRHKGAGHLRSPAVHMSIYRYLMLDIIGYVTLVIGLIVYSVWFIKRRFSIKIVTKHKGMVSDLVYYLMPIILFNLFLLVIYLF